MRVGKLIAGVLFILAAAGWHWALPVQAQQSLEECSTLGFNNPPEQILLGVGQVRVFAMHHKQCLQDVATYDSIYQALDHELKVRVDPYRSPDHPNVVVFNELTALIFGVEGSRGEPARDNADQVISDDQNIYGSGSGTGAIIRTAAQYGGPIAYYDSPLRFGPTTSQQAAVERLFTALTDTYVRATVENLLRLAKNHGVYIAMSAPLPIVEGSKCTGAYAGWLACPGWHKSTDQVDRCALGDPDLGGCSVPYVYVADTPDVDNVGLMFAPDGSLYDLQPKVNLTPEEEDTIGWHEGSPSTIHAIGLHADDAARFPQVKFGIAISLDAFEHKIGSDPCPPDSTVNDASGVDDYPQFMQCLDSKDVNIVLQLAFNSASKECMSWTDFSEGGCNPGSWQPVGWMHSSWFAVQGRNPDGSFVHKNFRYAVNPFLVGNLFDVAGDGQTAIFARDDPRATTGCYAGDCAVALYLDAMLGYVDHPDQPWLAPFEGAKPGFLALTNWTMTRSDRYWLYRTRGGQQVGSKDSLQACEKGMAPGSGIQEGDCAENNEKPSALVADLDVGPAPPAAPSLLPTTTPAGMPLAALIPLLAGAGFVVRTRRAASPASAR